MMTTMPYFKRTKKKSEGKEPSLSPNVPKQKPYDKNSTSYQGKDSREGRLNPIKTSKGNFTFKDNRKGD